MSLTVAKRQLEAASWNVVARVRKWDDLEALGRRGLLGLDLAGDDLAQELPPTFDGVWDHGNLLCTPGITRLLTLLIAGGGQGLDNAHCRVGVGNGSTTVTAADTDLSAAAGSSNRYFNMADATYPAVAANVLNIQSTFSTANGNFAWNEWGIDFGTAGGTTVTAPLLNRKVPASSIGTKGAGAPWAFAVSITVT